MMKGIKQGVEKQQKEGRVKKRIEGNQRRLD